MSRRHALAAALIAACTLALAAAPARAGEDDAPSGPGARWVVQLATGTAWQARSPLRISQDGEEDLDFRAKYETRPFTSGAPYYSLRLGRWREGRAWEVESHHHLVTLTDGPPEVEGFSITHGYNLNTVNRAWEGGGLVWRLGAGVVVTHPESVVRGKAFGDQGADGHLHLSNGFFLSGVCAQGAVEKRFPVGGGFALTTELKATAAWARVPVADGDAAVPNYALHALLGLAYTF